MILLIDNYDSFAYNLQRYLVRLGEKVTVVRNDDLRLAAALEGNPADFIVSLFDSPTRLNAMVLSPGPGRPRDAGFALALVRQLSGKLPILGVCLGHQIICEAFGGRIIRAHQPVHGLATPIEIDPSPLFAGLTSFPDAAMKPDVETVPAKRTLGFARYHSLVAETASLPECLKVTAWSMDGQIMAVEHRRQATFGIQFHPESILSKHGYQVLKNFLTIAGIEVCEHLPEGDLRDDEQVSTWVETCPQPPDATEEHAVVHPHDFVRR